MDLAWRFAGEEAAPGVWQMAADRYFFRAIEKHSEPVVVRLYRFSPHAISLGYHQDPERVVNLKTCEAAGIDVVRRPTGGRALLHRNEINYAVIADTARARLFGSHLSEAFERVSLAVAAGLSVLGLQVEVSAGKRGRSEQTTPRAGGLCAASTTRYEITCRGRKIAAAAQLRSADNLLQHGTIYLDESAPVPEGLFVKHSALIREAKPNIAMASLRDLLGSAPDLEVVVNALVAGFEEVLGANSMSRGFQPSERESIAALASEVQRKLAPGP